LNAIHFNSVRGASILYASPVGIVPSVWAVEAGSSLDFDLQAIVDKPTNRMLRISRYFMFVLFV
jgi:hypothetical protein